MFATIYKSLFNKSKMENNKLDPETVMKTRQNVENLLTDLCEVNDTLNDDDNSSKSKDNSLESIELSFDNIHLEYLNDNDSVDNFDDSKNDISFDGNNKPEVAQIENFDDKKLINQINSLQCPFTWNLKQNHKISRLQNEYGEYNLDISSQEFLFERLV
jgi:hypothetical protein